MARALNVIIVIVEDLWINRHSIRQKRSEGSVLAGIVG